MMRDYNYQRCYFFHPAILVCLCILFLPLPVLSETDSHHSQEKLARLQKKINALQAELEKDNQEKDMAVHKLKMVETQISTRATQIRNLDRQLAQAKTKMASLTDRQQELENQFALHRHQLRKQIQSSYAMGKQEYVKLLLNQQNPSDVARMVVYYQYFNKSRLQHLAQIDTGIGDLLNVKKKINNKSTQLQELKLEATEEKKLLETSLQQRKVLVANLTDQLKSKDHALQSLLRDEQHLKRLLNQLEDQLDDVNADLAHVKEFVTMRGKLPWPTRGKVTAKFGSSRHAGKLKWKGTMIQTQIGDSIRAIAYGRVVFADWLRGFGMLIIVDHGKGYMSLYGHNQQLHKNLGDWVQAGETIATAGNSGGQNVSSLYFEIRHNGVPQNPAKWCHSTPNNS